MGISSPRRQYDREFKINASRLVIEGGRRASEVARDLGINANMLCRWRQELTLGPEQAFRRKGQLGDKDE